MKLDRNLNADGHGKYGLILNRRLAAIDAEAPPGLVKTIHAAIETLEKAGLLDWGTTPDSEFFVMRLRDVHAAPALRAYAGSAGREDMEYGTDVQMLAVRASNHFNVKRPD